MSINEKSRRASGAAMEANRRAIGTNMEQSRRANGAEMEANRRGQQVVEDLNRLTSSAPQRKTLRRVEPVGALPASRGRGVYKAPPVAAGGGSMSWPLVEGAQAGEEPEFARTYYDSSTTIVTTDGLLRLEVLQVKSIAMHDANGAVGELRFAKRPSGEGEP